MSYIINNSRGNIVAVVADGTVNTTATDVALVGRAVTNYGEYQNENYVYLLENFANGTAPMQPILGQLWYNSTTDVISAYNTANTWTALASQTYVDAQKVSPVFSGVPTAPTASVSTNTTQLATTAFVQNQLSSASGITTVGTITGGNLLTSGLVSATGNVIGANFIGNVIPPAGGAVSTSGNVTGGNILTSGLVSATGNVIGANFIGNVIPPAGGAVSTSGNVTGGNILTSGLVSAGGNITGGNLRTAGVISATGNITSAGTVIANTVIANNVITTGSTSAFRLPNLNQTQINALTPQNGDLVYNTTTNLPQVYQNGSWNNFTISYYS
jgi:hypothetical protein